MLGVLWVSCLFLSALAAPQVHQSAVSYSVPGHSGSFVASNTPTSSAISSSTSNSLLNSNVVSAATHALSVPTFQTFGPVVNSYGYTINHGPSIVSPTGPEVHIGSSFASSQSFQNRHDFETPIVEIPLEHGEGYGQLFVGHDIEGDHIQEQRFEEQSGQHFNENPTYQGEPVNPVINRQNIQVPIQSRNFPIPEEKIDAQNMQPNNFQEQHFQDASIKESDLHAQSIQDQNRQHALEHDHPVTGDRQGQDRILTGQNVQQGQQQHFEQENFQAGQQHQGQNFQQNQYFEGQNFEGQNYQHGQNLNGQNYQQGQRFDEQDYQGGNSQQGERFPQGQNYQHGQNFQQGQNVEQGQYFQEGQNFQRDQHFEQGQNLRPSQNLQGQIINNQNFHDTPIDDTQNIPHPQNFQPNQQRQNFPQSEHFDKPFYPNQNQRNQNINVQNFEGRDIQQTNLEQQRNFSPNFRNEEQNQNFIPSNTQSANNFGQNGNNIVQNVNNFGKNGNNFMQNSANGNNVIANTENIAQNYNQIGQNTGRRFEDVRNFDNLSNLSNRNRNEHQENNTNRINFENNNNNNNQHYNDQKKRDNKKN